MSIEPIIPLWLLAVFGLAGTCMIVWRLLLVRHDRRLVLLWMSRLVMLALVIAIGVRPSILGDGQGPSASGGLEVYFAVDTTSSMAAEDWDGQPGDRAEPSAPPTRLDGVRADIESIVDTLAGAQFSLVSFDSTTVQRVPLTSDDTAILSAASVLRQEVTAYSRGSSIGEPVVAMERILREASEANPDQRRVLFYFGDGEQTASRLPGSFLPLAAYLDGGAVLGYGTDTGGRMRVFDGVDPRYFGQDSAGDTTEQPPAYIQEYSSGTGVDALSIADEAALKTIAGQLGVTYLHRTAATSTALATTGIEVGDIVAQGGEPGTVTELYWIFAVGFGLLALVQMVAISGAVGDVRPRRRSR